jgi:hypothetical protein
MRLSIYYLYTLCALALVFTGQAMAGEWTDEFEDEEQMAEVWTPLFGNWVFMNGIVIRVSIKICGGGHSSMNCASRSSS